MFKLDVDVPAALAVAVGAACVQWLPHLPPRATLIAGCAVAAVGVFLPWRVVRWLAWACLGLSWFGWRADVALARRLPVAMETRAWTVRATVRELPERFAEGWRFVGDVEVLDDEDQRTWRGRMAIYRDDRVVLMPGSVLTGTARLRAPRGLRNDGAFDFERYALARGIELTGYFQSLDRVELPKRTSIDAWRQRWSLAIARNADDPRAAGLLRALAVGDQAAIADVDWQVLRDTGTAHLVAISGFHIGLFAVFGVWCVRGAFRVWPRMARRFTRPQVERWVAMICAVGYGLLAGPSLPVWRTVGALCLVATIGLARRHTRPGLVLAWCVVASVLIDPLSTMTAGFWLSFGGVAWLLMSLRRGEHSAWREFLRAQGAVSLGLLPLGVVFFGQVSWIGPLANLVLVPWTSFVVLPALIVASAVTACTDWSWPMRVALRLADLFWWLADRFAAVPGASWTPPAPNGACLVLALLGAACCLLPRAVRGRGWGAVLFLPLLWPRLPGPEHGGFRVEMLDVGQGLALIVRTSAHALVFDAGPAPEGRLDLGEAIVLPVLAAEGVQTLDRIVISHPDNDHAGGLDAVRARLPAPVWGGPGVRAAQVVCRAGLRWTWDGVQFEILHPDAGFPALDNDSSCVLRIDNGHAAALLPADISTLIEDRLIARSASALRADLLIVPHHGSRGSSGQAFVDAVRPRFAAVSAGYRSRFGHPAPVVVARYRAAGATVIDTASAGQVIFEVDGAGQWRVTRERQDRPRFWQAR